MPTFNIHDARLAAKCFEEVAEWPAYKQLAANPLIRKRYSSSPRPTGPWLKQRLVLGPEDNPADEEQPTKEEYEAWERENQDGSTTESTVGSSVGDRPSH